MGILALQTRLALVVAVQCGLASALHGASVEALYNEINKLPPQQRQKRLEDGPRREGAFVQRCVVEHLHDRIHEKVSIHQGRILAR